jgi:hypothetical protein
LGHGAHGGLGEDEVAEGAVGCAPDTVDAGDEGEDTGGGVVRPVGLGPDAGVQSHGEDVDEGFVGRAGVGMSSKVGGEPKAETSAAYMRVFPEIDGKTK